jgi:hypothetical protein
MPSSAAPPLRRRRPRPRAHLPSHNGRPQELEEDQQQDQQQDSQRQHWLRTGVDMFSGRYLWNFFKHSPAAAVRAKAS